MDEILITSRPESEQPNESLNDLSETELNQVDPETVEDVATVADEILVEVKECQTKLAAQTAALAHLQENGGGPATKQEIQEALTEMRNTREELRNLLAELKELNQPSTRVAGDSSPSTLSTPPQTVEVVEIIPEENAGVQKDQKGPQKKKRFRI
jgi:hypothetical protein